MKEELEIFVEQVGTSPGYEHYHNEYYLNGEKIGSSSYDKKQDNGGGLHHGSFEGKYWERHKKSFYAKTPEGIAWKMQRKLKEIN